jgi:hypothetical protein
MANIEKNTIYQQLNSFMNLDGKGFEQQPQFQQKETKIIIKGNSPEEIKRKGLEIEQKNSLQNKFFKVTERGFQKALQYEAARLPAYMDFEGMEYYPIISSALDLFMEEATTIGSNGKMLNIYSSKERIKSLLEEFFYDTVNVNVNLPFWTRNTVKYGDNFVMLYGEKNKGITHVKQMVNYEIERLERVQNGKPFVKFKERMTGDEFNSFEIAHFRLLGDDKFIPYGSSILNKIRRVFRQLIMAEDAMLTYRIIRAGEKRVFKIDVGNIDEDDIEDYMYKVVTKFKKTSQISPNDGQIDYRFNIMGNDEDYFLPVRNANSQTGIETLPGASNLNDINDIEYLRDNLFIGLGIPKPFLSFQDASGAGKNMAQYDVRFAKKVNRIQQAMIQELNKMAMIHLFLLGYSGEDLTDFTLTLTNPSTQQDLLKSELLREQAQTYTELTRGENGIAAMSHTLAKRRVFNMSDKEIVEDLKQQKMEKVVMQELADAPVLIKKSGLFDDIDKRYGEPTNGTNLPPAQQPAQQQGLPPTGGGGNMGANTEMPPMGNEALPPTGGGGTPPLMEKANKGKLTISEFNDYVENMIYGNKKVEEINRKNIINETVTINNELNSKAIDLEKETEELLNEDIIELNLDEVKLDDIK